MNGSLIFLAGRWRFVPDDYETWARRRRELETMRDILASPVLLMAYSQAKGGK